MKAVGFLKEGDDTLHACQSLFTGDIAAVYSGKDSHDAEAAAAGSDDVGVVLRIYAVYMIAFGGKTAVRFRAFPEVEESPSLDGIHQGIIRQ